MVPVITPASSWAEHSVPMAMHRKTERRNGITCPYERDDSECQRPKKPPRKPIFHHPDQHDDRPGLQQELQKIEKTVYGLLPPVRVQRIFNPPAALGLAYDGAHGLHKEFSFIQKP